MATKKVFVSVLEREANRCRVSDPHHFNADQDLAFQLNADLDPAFHFNADPDPAPHQSAGNLLQLIFRASKPPF
jgi:hypothetical protein